jgi:hypothetical protein
MVKIIPLCSPAQEKQTRTKPSQAIFFGFVTLAKQLYRIRKMALSPIIPVKRWRIRGLPFRLSLLRRRKDCHITVSILTIKKARIHSWA